jgi:predicted outer membrane repeat protein
MKKRLLLPSLFFFALGSAAQTVTVYRAGTATLPVYTTIKDAVAAALPDDSLVLSADTFKEYKIIIDKNLSLTGTISATAKSTIDATHDSTAIMLLNPSAGPLVRLLLQDLDLKNGAAKDNTGKGGGAVCADAGTLLTLDKETSLYDNEATSTAPNGGAIYSEGAISIKGNSRLLHNIAFENGGALYSAALLSLGQNSLLDSNRAGISGGGIYSSGDVQVRHFSRISSNRAQTGGGIAMSNGVLSIANQSLVTSNKTTLHGAGIVLLNSHFTMSDSSIIGFNKTDTTYAAAIYAKGNNDLYVRGGQIIGNQSVKAGAAGIGMAIYNDSASGGSAIVSVSNARIFNPRADYSRQNELYNLHEASAFLTDSSWWGESDTTGLFYNPPAALTSYRSWVIADWYINNGLPVTSLSSFPVEARFRLNTGWPLSPYLFWMLEGQFSSDYGSFSPLSVPMSPANRIGSIYSIPATSTMVNIQGIADADTFRKAVWILVVSIRELGKKSDLSVYPNPGNGNITISVSGNAPGSATVLDLCGRTVYRQELVFSGNSSRLHLDIPSGQYLLRLEDTAGAARYEQISITR